MDDSQIVDLYLQREESAILYTSQKYGAKLRQIAAAITGSDLDAEECENDTYLETWQRIPPHEPRTYLFAFLGRIIRHLAIDRVRKDTRVKRQALLTELTDEMSECLPGADDVEQEIEQKELRELINAFLEACSEAEQTLFVRRYWYFDSISELCRRSGLTESNVKVTLYRLRGKLKTRLEKEGYGK